MNAKRKELEKQIIKFASASDFIDASKYANAIPEYINLLSVDIAEAIGSINPICAPFIIALLEDYIVAIRKNYPDIDKTVNILKNIDKKVVEVRIPPNE